MKLYSNLTISIICMATLGFSRTSIHADASDTEQAAHREIVEMGFDAYFALASDTPKKLIELYGRYPQNATVRHIVGRQMLREKNYRGATVLLTLAAENLRDREMVQTDAGMAHEKIGDFSGALRYYLQALNLSPYSAFRYNDCARAYEALGDRIHALSYYKKSLSILPAQPEIEKKVAKSYED